MNLLTIISTPSHSFCINSTPSVEHITKWPLKRKSIDPKRGMISHPHKLKGKDALQQMTRLQKETQ